MSTPFSPHSDTPWTGPAVSHDVVTQEWCVLHRLIEELSAVQARLGTPLEQPADYRHVRELGHKIRAKLHLVQVWAENGLIARDEILTEAVAL
ncbi:MAG: hypothetical protein QM790_01310 [Nibricoccus sp.]